MGYFNQRVLGIAMALLVFAFVSCTSKPESGTSQTGQQKQESSMATQEQEEQESSAMAQSQEEEEESSPTAQSPEQPTATPEEAEQARETSGDKGIITVTGTVESGLDGMVITTDDGTYAISGKDLSDMMGMTVRVTGALKESEGQRTIEATDVAIVE